MTWLAHYGIPSATPESAREDDWRVQGLCRSDMDLFHVTEGNTAESRSLVRQAKEICHACPVIAQCRDWYDKNPDGWAIAAGTTPGERRRTKRATAPTVEPQHGTIRGFWRHRTNREPPCEECRVARRIHERVGKPQAEQLGNCG